MKHKIHHSVYQDILSLNKTSKFYSSEAQNHPDSEFFKYLYISASLSFHDDVGKTIHKSELCRQSDDIILSP